MRLRFLLAGAAAAAGLATSARADDSGLAERLDVLTEEIRRLKEQMVLPETDDELQSYAGLGPAASKVYAKTSGLALGGYGEFRFEAPQGADAARIADFHRFITYVGYKFSEQVVMNTEIEFEHATTSSNFAGKSGSVSVEFSYLDFLLHDTFNVRAGNLLAPIGFVNVMHEPPFYRGNVRPEIETNLIPSTWRELGVAFYGTWAETFTYDVALLNGFNAKKFGASGVRGGRQKGNRVLWEDVGVLAGLNYQLTRSLAVGGTGFTGGADQGQEFDGETIDATTTIAEAHAQLRARGVEARVLVASSWIDGAAEISNDLSDDESTVVIPERQVGFSVEAAYDVARELGLSSGQSLRLWTRYEDVDLHREVPTGLTRDPTRDVSAITVGVEYLPHPNVVLKVDQTFQDDEAGSDTEDPLRVGAGFVF